MSTVFAHCTLTRQLLYSQRPGNLIRDRCCLRSKFSCRPCTHQRLTVLGCAASRLSSAEDFRQDFAPLGVVARKLLVNVSALFFLVLAESVPLCCADPTSLPKRSLQLFTATSVASHGTLQLLHPFLLGIAPFVEAMIFCQMIGAFFGWNKLPVPPRFKLSRTQTQTPYGRTAITFLSSVLGAAIATGLALLASHHLISVAAVGHAEWLDITAALVAGSAIIYKLSEFITQFGLGQGISFIYMVSIASSAHQSFFALLCDTNYKSCGFIRQCVTVKRLISEAFGQCRDADYMAQCPSGLVWWCCCLVSSGRSNHDSRLHLSERPEASRATGIQSHWRGRNEL